MGFGLLREACRREQFDGKQAVVEGWIEALEVSKSKSSSALVG